MGRKPVVLLDVDGVIADFAGEFINVAGRVLNRTMPPEADLTEWDLANALGLSECETRFIYSELNKPGVARKLGAYPGAVEAVHGLSHIAEIYFVTSPMDQSPTWCHDRLWWLIDNFGLELGSKLVLTQHKHLVFGDMLVDDRVPNITEWASHRPSSSIGVVWGTPSNTGFEGKGNVCRVLGWTQVIELVKEML